MGQTVTSDGKWEAPRFGRVPGVVGLDTGCLWALGEEAARYDTFSFTNGRRHDSCSRLATRGPFILCLVLPPAPPGQFPATTSATPENGTVKSHGAF